MARTPQEVFEHHGAVLGAGDIDGIVEDCSDDAIIFTPGGVLRGKDGVWTAFEILLGDVPDAAREIPTQIFEEDILFITWSARSEKAQVRDAVDTFVFRDGLIRVQTVQYAVEPVAG
jgi:hypothetical protein